MVTLFAQNKIVFERKVKCYEMEIGKAGESPYCMNSTIFRVFKYIIKYSAIAIEDAGTLHDVIEFLYIFSLCSNNRKAIQNIRKIANECICMLVNKCPLTTEVCRKLVSTTVENTINLIHSRPDVLDISHEYMFGRTFCILKGLLLRGYPEGYSCVVKILSLLKETSYHVRELVVVCWRLLLKEEKYERRFGFKLTPLY